MDTILLAENIRWANQTYREMEEDAIKNITDYVLRILVALCVLLLVVLGVAQWVLAAEVQLAWDPNTEEDLAGYRLYHRAEGEQYGTYTHEIAAPDSTVTLSYPDGRHYWRLTAFDQANNESGFSNEINAYVSAPADVTPPAVPGGVGGFRVTVIIQGGE